MSLDQRLSQLLAEAEGVSPGEITVSFIERRREQYNRTVRYEIESDYGGYDLAGLNNRSLVDLEKLEAEADAWLAEVTAN